MRLRIAVLLIPLLLILVCGLAFSNGRKPKSRSDIHYRGQQIVHVSPGQLARSCRATAHPMPMPTRMKMRHLHGVSAPIYRAVPPRVLYHHHGRYGGYHPYPHPPAHPRRSGVRGYIGINVGIGIGF